MNLLYYGDNLPILRDHVPTASVDLIYLDPPFNSNRSYNVLFKEESGLEGEAQIHAFDDAWHWGTVAEQTYQELVANAPMSVATMISAFRQFIGANQMLAYLVMMTARLVELHRVLKPTGSLYLHCDPTASHYLKIILDTIFGAQNFRNEIVWKRSSAHSDTKQGRKLPGRLHDILLFYTKSDDWTWNPFYTAYDPEYLVANYRYVDEVTKRRFKSTDLTAAKPGGDTSYPWKGHTPPKGRYWAYSQENMQRFETEGRLHYTGTGLPRLKQYLDEMPGVALQDIWTDISPIAAQAAERLGYPTQKPVALLERIIQASSNPGDVVLDPFCVRKGTGILTPLRPPACGGMGALAPSPRAGRVGEGCGSQRNGNEVTTPLRPPACGGMGETPSPHAGRAGEGCGVTAGDECAIAAPETTRVTIESLQPGQWVFAHDGEPHRILRTVRRDYHGLMVGIERGGYAETLWVTAEHSVLCQRRTQEGNGDSIWRRAPGGSFDRARQMRREMTDAERLLWSLLRRRQLGAKFRRQHPLGPYIADFYSRDGGLVVEVDGAGHSSPQARETDVERDAYLESLGLAVLRVANTDVEESPEAVCKQIALTLAQARPTEDTETQWRRADSLRPGDIVYCGVQQESVQVTAIHREETSEEVYDLEVEGAHSYVTDVCAVHNCGCGTTIAAAQKLGRTWIGIDVTHLAIALQKYRLKDSFGLVEGKDYKVVGEPTDLQGARKLARDDRYQFQWWALSLIKARPLGGEAGSKEGKKGSDKGVDGLMTFIDDQTAKAKIVLVQVKSGKVKSGDIRDLQGVIQTQKADMGVFVTMDEPTPDMSAEAVAAGFYHSPGWGKDYPRLQIVTVAALLNGAELKMPPAATTFKQAAKVHGEEAGQLGMGM